MKFINFGSVHINLDMVLYITAVDTHDSEEPLLLKFVFSETHTVAVRVLDLKAMNRALKEAIGYQIDVKQCG